MIFSYSFISKIIPTGERPELFPSAGLEENYCRNPTGRSRVWCHTTVDDPSWAFCKVPLCDGEEVVTSEVCGTTSLQQEDYRGSIAMTESGRECQRWDSQEPHEHTRTTENFPNAGLEASYCRNPDDEPRAWCYTTDADKRWEYCEIPTCGDFDIIAEEEELCYNCNATSCGSTSVNQADYRGTINITESGRTCQAWDSHEVHDHPNTSRQTYPDGGLEGNYCRNPDNEEGAWCYTTDPLKRWEYCSVPTCAEKRAPSG